GLRSDEITRLRVGCVRWQHHGLPIPADASDVLAEEAVCLLDVPVHKTGTAFTKPVDPLLGQAIEVWQRIRPSQPKTLDRKTAEHVDVLFAVRAQPVARSYLNRTVIPALCAKAGLPPTDVRGKITSHRARSTIASQLYNAKEPMTLFELQAWLGHASPASTQHYAKISPATLSKAYSEAGYFARNMRTIEVLLDREAVTSGRAGNGEPWQHYDLGHGYCSYSFFEQCPHRMACARCDFYIPKRSTRAHLLEGQENLQHMLVAVPLTDDERAAVEDGHAALGALVDRLTDVASPAGSTPRSLGTTVTPTQLPNVTLRPTRRTKRT
ncbi:MAG: tyrosine-type recombinase/integrase, partial [Acidimicrobiales bacterium]